MAVATITAKGQITIPKSVREKLMLGTGDKIEFIITENQEAIIRPVTKKVDDLYGRFYNRDRIAVSVEAMNLAIARKLKMDHL